MFKWFKKLKLKKHLSTFIDSGFPENSFYRSQFKTALCVRSYASTDILYLEEDGIVVGQVTLDDRGLLDRDIPIYDGGHITVDDNEEMEKILVATNFRIPRKKRFKTIQNAVDFALLEGNK